MVIELTAAEINRVLEGRKLDIDTPVGVLKLHSIRYIESRFEVLADYKIMKNIKCIAAQCTFKGHTIKAHMQCPDNKLAESALKLASKSMKQNIGGISLDFPELTVDIMQLDIPVNLQDIKFFSDKIIVSVELSGSLLNQFKLQSAK